MNISISNKCSESDVAFIRKKLIEYNTDNIGAEPIIEHARYVLRNDNNEIVGGISGIIYMDCLTIDLLWVSEELRGLGYGKKLLNEVENIAKSRKCDVIFIDNYINRSDMPFMRYFSRRSWSQYSKKALITG